MKVLHVLCDLSGGGAERLVLDLCQGASEGTRAEVATIFEGGSLSASFRDAGVKVHALQKRRGRLGLRAQIRLSALARQADLVHTHLWAGHLHGRPAARAAGVPVVSTLHNSRPDGAVRDVVERRSRGLCAALIAVSHHLEGQLRSGGEDHPRLVAIPNGIALSRFPPAPLPPGPMRILAMGRLTEQKGFDVLLRALQAVPEVSLELAGEGPREQQLRRLAAPLGERVRFLGFEQLPLAAIHRSHLVVVPSRWEGFGLVAAEAMACGRPVVASAVDALPEVVGQGGVLVPPEDPAALARAIGALAENRDGLEDLSRLALLGRDRHDIRRTIQATEALYHEVAAG